MNFKQFIEMDHSPVTAHFLLIHYPGNQWGVYLEDPFGDTKFLFNKWTANTEILKKEMEIWADSNNYSSFQYRIKSGTN